MKEWKGRKANQNGSRGNGNIRCCLTKYLGKWWKKGAQDDVGALSILEGE